MRMLVLGSRGQVASALRQRSKQNNNLSWRFLGRTDLDLENHAAIGPALERLGPDIVVNTAAWTDVDGAEDRPDRAKALNAVTPGVIAKTTKAMGARLIHLSTDYVFDGSKQSPYVEGDATNPINTYGKTKLAGEEAVRNTLEGHLILRTSWVYSPFGSNFVKTMLKLAAQTDSINVVDDQVGNPTSAHDIADVIIGIARKWQAGSGTGVNETFHCAGTGEASWATFASHVFSVSRAAGGPFAQVSPIATSEWPTRAQRPTSSRLDCTALSERFGFVLPNWRESSAKVVSRILETHC